MDIWISSFIPKTIDGLTLKVPGSPNQTMIPGPPLFGGFLTDQRGFSDKPDASARTRLLAKIDMTNLTLVSQIAHCDNTIEVDNVTGAQKCNLTPDSSQLRIVDVQTTGQSLRLVFSGGAGNPCVGAIAPQIEWLVKLEVCKLGANSASVTILSGSFVEPFPAFEMYVSWEAVTKRLFSRPPDPGARPWDIYGLPNKPVVGTVVFP